MSKSLVEELRERLLDENYHLAKLCRDHADEIERALTFWEVSKTCYNTAELTTRIAALEDQLHVILDETHRPDGLHWHSELVTAARAVLKGDTE